jgi:hypothetical protein
MKQIADAALDRQQEFSLFLPQKGYGIRKAKITKPALFSGLCRVEVDYP